MRSDPLIAGIVAIADGDAVRAMRAYLMPAEEAPTTS